jgi:hypothetical protein
MKITINLKNHSDLDVTFDKELLKQNEERICAFLEDAIKLLQSQLLSIENLIE